MASTRMSSRWWSSSAGETAERTVGISNLCGRGDIDRGMPAALKCDLCDKALVPHEHYIVRIEVLADPTMPPIQTSELEKHDYDKTMQDLLDEMKHLTADDLQDQVHR